MKGGAKVVVEQHRHAGVFIARGKEDALVTRNMVPGDSVYGEKRIAVEQEGGDKIEYRVWNPFRSKLAAAVLAGVDNIHIKPGAKVLYLGGASGTSVSHVSDVVGPEGSVYAVEFSHRRWATTWQGGQERPSRDGWVVHQPALAAGHAPLLCRPLPLTPRPARMLQRSRPGEHGEEATQRDPHHRGRAAPAEVPHAGADGGRRVCRRGAARPGAHRGPQLAVLPEERRLLRHLHQGLVHRLHGPPRGRVCARGEEAAGAAAEAQGAGERGLAGANAPLMRGQLLLLRCAGLNDDSYTT